MQFLRIEANDEQGNPLPKDAAGIIQCQWTNDVSEPIILVPVIDDDGDPQSLVLESSLMDTAFYMFSTGHPSKTKNGFPSAQPLPITVRIKQTPQGVASPPCRLRNTLFYTILDNGARKKRNLSKTLLFR
jgi:hypothetical protein